MNDLHIPRQIRAALYISITLGSPVVAYLQATERVGPNEMTLWLALTAAIALMAGLNLTPKELE